MQKYRLVGAQWGQFEGNEGQRHSLTCEAGWRKKGKKSSIKLPCEKEGEASKGSAGAPMCAKVERVGDRQTEPFDYGEYL